MQLQKHTLTSYGYSSFCEPEHALRVDLGIYFCISLGIQYALDLRMNFKPKRDSWYPESRSTLQRRTELDQNTAQLSAVQARHRSHLCPLSLN